MAFHYRAAAYILLASLSKGGYSGKCGTQHLGEQEARLMRPSWVLLVLLTTALLVPVRVMAASLVARGAALANACAACHGPDGHSQGAIPAIANLPRQDFIAALKAFRADTRQGTVMNLIAKGLDDTDINAVAAYFATLQQR
jgi:sulfide dehydrogenase cytochrome subunit